MKAQIVDVGDGACSVYTGEESVMVTDCGGGPTGNAISSAWELDQTVGSDSNRIETIVVTHFDADHWKGLAAYPAVLLHKNKIGALPKDVAFQIPRFPREAGLLPIAQLVLDAASATNSGPLGAALDLFGAWRRAGVRVTVKPTARCDTFTGADATWTCHWPPRDIEMLHGRSQQSIRRLNDELDQLRDQVPEFREAIQIASGIGWVSDDPQSDANGFASILTGRQLLDALNAHQSTLNVRDMVGRLRRYNNAFSLVHDTVGEAGAGLLANFGDCEKMGLDSLLRLQNGSEPLSLAAQYKYLLAPHHGTQEPSKKLKGHFPRVSRNVVAQNGEKHHLNQRMTFLQSLSPIATNPSTILDTYGSSRPIIFSL